jgi:hypothetical protein
VTARPASMCSGKTIDARPEGPTDPDRFGESSNLFYDIFTTSRRPGRGWSRNTRVTDKRSISDFIFNGDYFDITTSGDRLVFGIWTDRRHQTSIGASLDENGEIVIDEAALEDNVFGARLRGDLSTHGHLVRTDQFRMRLCCSLGGSVEVCIAIEPPAMAPTYTACLNGSARHVMALCKQAIHVVSRLCLDGPFRPM